MRLANKREKEANLQLGRSAAGESEQEAAREEEFNYLLALAPRGLSRMRLDSSKAAEQTHATKGPDKRPSLSAAATAATACGRPAKSDRTARARYLQSFQFDQVAQRTWLHLKQGIAGQI